VRRIFFILPFFLIIHSEARFKFTLPQEKIKFICLYGEKTSSVSKEEIFKFLDSSEKFHAEWEKTIKNDLKNYDYLILSKGKLSKFEKNAIFKFLKTGGGLVLFLPKDYDEGFLKKIGIKTYKIYGDNLKVEWDGKIFKSGFKEGFTPFRGILVKTGYGGKITQPVRGNVFPERIPVRDFAVLAKAVDENNNFLGSSIVLVKHWLNPWDINGNVPKKWFLFSGRNFNFGDGFYKQIAGILNSPFVVKDLKAVYPVYSKGEQIELTLEVFNLNARSRRGKFLIEVLHQDEVVYSIYNKRKFISGLNSFYFDVKKEIPAGFYELRCSFYNKGKVVDYFKNAFLVKDKNWDSEGGLKIEGNKFLINEKKEFLWGVNYYESKMGELMWLGPNLYRINQDFALMNKLGFKIVRIHYHHPKWFKDYLKKIDSRMMEFFPDKKYLPHDEDLRVLDSIIYLARLNDLIICFDLFTLVPREIGDPSGWLSMTERITNEGKIAAQLEFVKILAQRYKDVKGITWDLWNESRMPDESIVRLEQWVGLIIQQFRKNGDKHLITLGGNDSLNLEDKLDYLSVHSDKIATVPLSNKPVILQEFWLPEGLDKEYKQANDLEKIIFALKTSDYQGFMPWQWTRQSRLWDESEPEKWDDDLGLFLREDGSFKPSIKIFLR